MRVLARALAILFLFSVLFPQIANASDSREVDLVFVSWAGASRIDVTEEEIRLAVGGEVNSTWRNLSSIKGASSAITFSMGEVVSRTIFISRPMGCDSSSATPFMTSIRAEAYRLLGISNYNKRYLLIVTPNAGCIWLGRSLVGGRDTGGMITLQNTASSFVISHELGHALGLGHTNLLRCSNGAIDGPWGGECRAVEYGGTIDIMGNIDTKSPLSTFHQWRLGIISDEEVKESWVSEKIQLASVDSGSGLKAIFLRDGKSSYWLEYRKSSPENRYRPGLVMYRIDPPSARFVDSLNPEDSREEFVGWGIPTDLWMLNLDDYVYSISPTRASGSMTLPIGRRAQNFTGGIALQWSQDSNPDFATVELFRKPDTTPPPKPTFSSEEFIKFPELSILTTGYEDLESKIREFELRVDTTIRKISGSASSTWSPTYLQPFEAPLTVKTKDLPEGRYSMAVRAIDVWGNVSEWSDSRQVVIDRADPLLTDELEIVGVKGSSIEVAFSGAKDMGSGLCESRLITRNGWISQKTTSAEAPVFSFDPKTKTPLSLQIFDCNGNGLASDLRQDVEFVPASKTKRTGRWTTITTGDLAGALRCVGRCSATTTISDEVAVMVGPGGGTISINSKPVSTISPSSSNNQRVGAIVDIGKTRKLLRVSGSNLVLVGFAKVSIQLAPAKKIAQEPRFPDPSLDIPEQVRLSKFGFVQSDFTNQWIVLPMARGTTLQDPTLDLCEGKFSSESKRSARRQVVANSAGSPFSFLSSEVVEYQSIEAANEAFQELQAVFSNCIKDGGGIGATGIKTPYEFNLDQAIGQENPLSKNSLVVQSLIGSGSSARQMIAFYQFEGKFFSGLYVVRQGVTAYSREEVLEWFLAASSLATRLKSGGI